MIKICLAVFIGLPGTGKTTFCKQLLDKKLPFSVVHLQRRDVLCNVRNLISCIKAGVRLDGMFQDSSKFIEGSDKLLILIDDNNFYRSMRYEYYKLSKELKVYFCQVYFALPLHLAIERSSQRPNKVPTDVVIKMNNCLEPPSENHKWEDKVFVINHSECNSFQFEIFLNECFEFTIEEKEEPLVEVVEQSELHKVDLLLRKRVGAVIKELSTKEIASDVRATAAELNRKRKQILDDIRQGFIILEPAGNYDYLISLI